MRIVGMVLAASLAAVGNALFAVGQRQSAAIGNPLTSVTLAASVAVLLSVVVAPLFGAPEFLTALRKDWPAVCLSGVGLFLTYLGFNLMYSRYGASSYIVYAVLSVLTTTVVVGGLYFKERFTPYHYAAVACALLTVVLYSVGEAIE